MDRALSLLVVSASLLAFQANAAPTLTLSTSSLQSDSDAVLTHTITGIAAGETVTVERFADLNENGAIDFGEPSMRTFVVTDGVKPRLGGIVNGNVPGDADDVANAQIRVNLPFAGVDAILNRQPGKYIIRVTGPSGQATVPFEITAPNLPQRITGVLKNSANNASISFGIVVVLVGDGNPIGSVRTDATGTFNFVAPPGDYVLAPFSDGFVASPQFVSLPANQTVTQNLNLTPGPIRVSGKFSDASAGAGLPGVFVIGQVNANNQPSLLSGSLTDLNGDYAFNVTAGTWEVGAQEEFTSQIGYVSEHHGSSVTAVSAPITQNLTAQKATALIYGHVTDPSNNPIQGLAMRGQQNTGQNLEAQGRTSVSGDYFVGVVDGGWELNTDGASLLGFRDDQHSFTISAGTATHYDIVLATFTAHVRGRVTDASGNGISGVDVQGHYQSSNDTSSSGRTVADGSFDVPVWGGEWDFRLDESASLINHNVHLTVVDGVDQTITFIVPAATGQISGDIKNSSNQGLSGIFVNAQANINGVDYQSTGQTDSTGHYQIPVINGNWSLSLSCGDLQSQNYECPQTQFATINNNNATINFNIQTFVTTASLNGKLLDATGAGIGGAQVSAYNQAANVNRNADTQADGSFSIPVYGGQWSVQANNLPSSFISPNPQFTVTDGININNIQLKLLAATATVSGTVKNSGGAAVSGIRVYANATINNTSYYLPYTTTDASGAFTFSIAPGTWNINLDCSDLGLRNYNCANGQNADASSGSATANFIVTTQGVVTAPNIASPRLNLSNQTPMFEFTLEGSPGTYDIQGSTTVPFSATPAVVNTVTINPGNSGVFVSFAPGANQFFRIQAR